MSTSDSYERQGPSAPETPPRSLVSTEVLEPIQIVVPDCCHQNKANGTPLKALVCDARLYAAKKTCHVSCSCPLAMGQHAACPREQL